MLKDRDPPRAPDPVSANGIRYEAVMWGKSRGLRQNGGYVAAIDERTDEELWLAKVYTVRYGNRSPDKDDVFITSLALDENAERLTVENQRNERYVLDLKTREVSRK